MHEFYVFSQVTNIHISLDCIYSMVLTSQSDFIEFSSWFRLWIIYHSNGKNIGNGQFTTNVFDP